MFIGVCGNIAVLILTNTSKFWSKEKTETFYLVGNLALADLLMCLTFYPTWIVEFVLTILDVESDQLLFCKFCRSFAFSLLFASVASLLVITVDRYIYIVQPMRYPLIVIRRRVFVAISAIWLTACCIFAIYYVYIPLDDIGWRSFCFLSDSIAWPLDTFATHIPISVMIILNLQILFISRKQCKKIMAEVIPAPDHLNRNTLMRLALRFFVSRKAAKTFSIVVVVLIFCIFAQTIISAALKSFCSKAIL